MEATSDPISGSAGFPEDEDAIVTPAMALERDLASRKPPNFRPKLDQGQVLDTADSIEWAESYTGRKLEPPVLTAVEK